MRDVAQPNRPPGKRFGRDGTGKREESRSFCEENGGD